MTRKLGAIHQSFSDLPQDKNLRAVLGHKKLKSTVQYLGIEINDALEMAEQAVA